MKNLRYPIRIYLEITDRCNFKCVHCYLGNGKISNRKDISFHLFRKIVHEMEEIGIFSLILGGGEPLMHPHISRMLQYLSRARLFPAITTNGYFVDTKFIDTLETIRFTGSIQVSIHGKNPKTHNQIVGHPRGHCHAMNAIQQLLAHGVNVTAAVTPTRRNYKEIPSLLEELENMGVTSFNVIFALPVGRATKNLVLKPDECKSLRECIQSMKTRHTVFTDYNLQFESGAPKNPIFQYYCTCGVAHATIDPEGTVFPCSLLKYPQFQFGSCTTRTLKEIFDHPEKDIMRNLYGVSPPECSTCVFEHMCKGGCRAVAFTHHGKLLAQDIRCPKRCTHD